MTWAKKWRCTVSPNALEVNVKAIPILNPAGWQLLGEREGWALIGAVPKHLLTYDRGGATHALMFIAKMGRMQNAALRECMTEEVISKIGCPAPRQNGQIEIGTSADTWVRAL